MFEILDVFQFEVVWISCAKLEPLTPTLQVVLIAGVCFSFKVMCFGSIYLWICPILAIMVCVAYGGHKCWDDTNPEHEKWHICARVWEDGGKMR